MVKAILSGAKSQTRRVVKPRPFAAAKVAWCGGDGRWRFGTRRDFEALEVDVGSVACPFGEPGDLLWVRETFRPATLLVPEGTVRAVEYRADGETRYQPRHRVAGLRRHGDWTPSIFMPRWASRITLRIEDIRVERLHSITEADAIAEGFSPSVLRWWQGFERDADGHRRMVEGGASPDGPPPEWMESPEIQTMTTTAVEAFRLTWDGLNGPRGFGWDSDCWVFALTFRRVEG
jgi:hypothetical protein